ncbi:hypothetical protein I2494_18105 [Budviciaceae bacterium BWR-B9]|uniref:Type 1 fimbrial protein n=1 Tax=Limnobaculum allomyrinae TaxID=2791986 RepID=A0ABS1IUZ8_9GAMM|nr:MULTISPECIES: hypothetical protein [Limnobaculum]MBK5145593.1 hypothetical protein [Limnobaculum allomyrinae]MBV7693712.1 hypothetical protein [Limnobaculum sp. M2-1]
MNNIIKRIIALTFVLGMKWGYAAELYPNNQPIWNNGAPAANCSFTYPTLQPLSQQKNLIVENSLPLGSVIYSWSYGDFAPDFYSVCNGVTEYTTISSETHPELRIIDRLDFNNLDNNLLAGQWLWGTNNPGIALKLYIILTARGDQSTGYTYEKYSRSTYVSNAFDSIPLGQEIAIVPSFSSTNVIDGTMSSIRSDNTSKIVGSAHSFRYSVRAELIKIGEIQTGSPLSLSSSITMIHAFFMQNKADSSPETNIGPTIISPETIFGGGGITFVKPSCRLRGATDYLVELGEWSNTTNLPTYGDVELIDINIECNGSVGNVEFGFQDVGAFPLTNRNISVYDSAGGQLIEGMEVEMSYGGTRLNVHKMNESVTTYKTNTGAHGSIKTDASDLGFNSQSQAQFGVRFIQRAPITRGGSAYTGPVTGQVNMFVTYY